MALKDIVKTMHNEGYAVKPIDTYLESLASKDNDRRWDINSPSSAGRCPRGIVYSRLGYDMDVNCVPPRTRRIFDNGTHTHIRLQDYLTKSGALLMDEVPVFNDELEIQGHTDGLLKMSRAEAGILEIKSINSDGFRQLKDAKEEHKEQAQVYLFCLEKRRQFLKRKCKSQEDLDKYLNSARYKRFIRAHYLHLKDGHAYTAEEKFKFKLDCHKKADQLIYDLRKPITKMIFLYENKDTQDLKEFIVKYDEELMEYLTEGYDYINEYVEAKKIPPRPEDATSKSCQYCRWCNFKLECWIV